MLISPFWNQYVFYYTYYNEQPLFRISDDEELLNSVGSSISTAFFSAFSPTSLFIATWVESENTYYFQNEGIKVISCL